MTIQQLGYFLKLAEELNYTVVANQFFITQPTLSRQISNLEQELKVTLFIREHNGVKLSREGSLFYQKLKPIFLDLMKLIQKTQDSNVRKDVLMIGVQEEQLMSNSLTLAINRIRNLYPDLTINIHRCTMDELMEALENGTYDIINMMKLPTISMSMPADFMVLETEPMYMAIARKLAPDLPDRISTEEFQEYLDKYPLIMPNLISEGNVDETKIINDLFINSNMMPKSVRVIQSGTPISQPIQVTSCLGISVCNRSNIFSVDPEAKIAEIIGSTKYIKGVFYKKEMDNFYLGKLVQLLREEAEKTQKLPPV